MTRSKTTEAAIWESLIHTGGKLRRRDVACSILDMAFSPQERDRMHDLVQRQQAGALSTEAESELDHYNRVATLLSILKSKARKLLKHRQRAS